MTKKCQCGRLITWISSEIGPGKCQKCLSLDEKAKKAVEAVQDRPVTYEFMKGLGI